MNLPIGLPDQSGTVKVHLVFALLIVLCFVACYHDVLQWMFVRYTNPDSYYSHGFLIPLVSAYFVWQKKNEISSLPIESSLWGMGLLILSVLLHITGTILYIFSISGFSIILFLFGISLFLLGKKITRVLIFPLVFLIFMFPLPIAVIGAISYPMKMLVAKIGVGIISLMGIPILREGFHITIPAGNLLVGNPCSGLRSLISFLALGAIFSYIAPMSFFRKWILFSLSFPIALISNMIRVPILILISNFWGLAAASPDSFWHDASGMLVFVIGFLALFYAERILAWKS